MIGHEASVAAIVTKTHCRIQDILIAELSRSKKQASLLAFCFLDLCRAQLCSALSSRRHCRVCTRHAHFTSTRSHRKHDTRTRCSSSARACATVQPTLDDLRTVDVASLHQTAAHISHAQKSAVFQLLTRNRFLWSRLCFLAGCLILNIHACTPTSQSPMYTYHLAIFD